MQPLQIGMNSALVLLALLLAVPLQLFLTQYINNKYGGTPNTAESGSSKDIQSVRIEALNRLSDGMFDLVDYIQDTFQYYSKWGNLKELFVVPYDKRHHSYGSQGKVLTTKTSKAGKVASSKATITHNKGTTQSVRTTTSKAAKQAGSKSLTEKAAKAMENSDEYFANSETPRTTRPSHLKFKVGQVVKHRDEGYFGVIIGWDEMAKAPQKWIKRYYSNREDIIDTPHYLVLVDSRFSAASTPLHYLPQDDLLVIEANVQIKAPEMSKYFEGFTNHRHIPRPWLQQMYPIDSD